MSRSSRTSRAGLFLRVLLSERSASLVIALLILVASTVVTLAPRAMEQLLAAELRYSVDSLPGNLADLSGTTPNRPAPGTGERGGEYREVWGTTLDAVAAMPEQRGPELAAALGDGRIVSTLGSYFVGKPGIAPDEPDTAISMILDPEYEQQVRLVEGTAPGDTVAELHAATERFYTTGDPSALAEAPALEIALTAEVARDQADWQVGEIRSGVDLLPGGGTLPIVLTGIYEVIDQEDPYWTRLPLARAVDLYDDGNRRPIAFGMAFIHPDALASVNVFLQAVNGQSGARLSTQLWYPVDTEAITTANAPELLAQLSSVANQSVSFGEGFSISLDSETIARLERAMERSAALTSVVASVGAGPLGVVLATLALATRLLLLRRRPTLALATARGASAGQLRGTMALTGLILGLPAAIGGAGIGMALLPSPLGAEWLLLPALLALAPVILLAGGSRPAGLLSSRSDLDPRGRGRVRWIAELAVALAATAAVAQLLLRGLGGSSTVTVDPLLVIAPLLLALAFCALLLRLYPLPLALVERRFARGPGVVGFLGAVRSRRDPAGGLAPVLALVLSVAVLVFSSLMLGTLTHGLQGATESTVGGDLRLKGPPFSEETLLRIEGIDGVEAVVPVQEAGASPLRVDGGTSTTTLVYVTDLAALADLQAGLSDAVPRVSGPLTGEPVPVVMSSRIAEGEEYRVDGVAVQPLARQADFAGSGVRSPWIIVDRSMAEALGVGQFIPRLLFLDLAPGTDVDAVVEEATAYAGSLSWQSRDLASAEIQGSPSVTGLPITLAVAGIAVALLTALSLILVFVLGAADRTALLARLRTLGISGRQAQGLVAWEIAPVVVVAVVGGTALGFLLTGLMLLAVPLRSFTGGRSDPALALDPLLLGCVLIGFLAVVTITAAAALAAGRRANTAARLRMGDD